MKTTTITYEGRALYCASAVSELAYISAETVRAHAAAGKLPFVVVNGRRWFDADVVREHFTKPCVPRKNINRHIYKRDDMVINGRLCHPMRWYKERYGTDYYKMSRMPIHEVGKRMKYIAEGDFFDWYANRRGKHAKMDRR